MRWSTHVRPVVRLVTRVVVPTRAGLFLQPNIHTKCELPRNVMHWRRLGGANKVKRHRICFRNVGRLRRADHDRSNLVSKVEYRPYMSGNDG